MLKCRNELLEDLRAEMSKSKNGTKRDTLIKKLIKDNEKNQPQFVGYREYNDKYVFLHDYRMYVLNDNFGYNKMMSGFNVDNVMPNKADQSIEIKVDIADLKVFIADNKGTNNPYVCKKDDFKIGFNPKYLLEFLQMFDTDTIYCQNKSIAPAYTENENGEFGIVLLMRLK